MIRIYMLELRVFRRGISRPSRIPQGRMAGVGESDVWLSDAGWCFREG